MNTKKIIIGGVVIVLVSVGIYYFAGSQGAPPAYGTSGIVVQTPYGLQVASEIAEFDKIRKISLNFALFDDKLFQALHSAGSSASSTMARGRANPFVPF